MSHDHQHVGMSEDDHEKFHDFITGVNAVLVDVFGDQKLALTIGMRYGSFGGFDYLPCAVITNYPVPLIGPELDAMQHTAALLVRGAGDDRPAKDPLDVSDKIEVDESMIERFHQVLNGLPTIEVSEPTDSVDEDPTTEGDDDGSATDHSA